MLRQKGVTMLTKEQIRRMAEELAEQLLHCQGGTIDTALDVVAETKKILDEEVEWMRRDTCED